MDIARYEVSADKLSWRCDPEQFKFECTEDLMPLHDFIGQDRAIHAVELGLNINKSGYNIYVAGLTGTGKTTMVKTYIERTIKAKEAETGAFRASDWCYLYNFSDFDRPHIVELPQGKGKALKSQVSSLLQRVKDELSKAFASDEYKEQRRGIVEETQGQQRQILEELAQAAREQGLLFQVTPYGPALIPTANGKPLTHEDYVTLENGVRKAVEEKRGQLMKQVQDRFERARDLEQESAEKLRLSDRKVAEFTIGRLFRELMSEYESLPGIMRFLEALETYTLDHLAFFRQQELPPSPIPGVSAAQAAWGRDPFLPYEVNVFVDNSETSGQPVIVEPNPTFGNLFGKIERRFLLGGYLSDHSMLKPGAMNLANGGYLLLNVRDVLSKPGVWEGLKRAIKNKELRIEDPFEQFGLVAPQGLRPQPMPIDVKVVLIGDAYVYQLLSAYDEDFWEIFKVKADFDFQIDRTDENINAYACFIARCCREEQTRHFERGGVAKLLEYGARAVADQDKLLSRFAQIRELIVEADYWAGKAGSSLIRAEHVQLALEEKIYRHNLVDERMRDMIRRGTLMIDVDGAVTGQVNGLSVYTLGDIAFGKPSRITAKTFMGRSGVVNIEREAQLSGPIHNKGVLILSGYLGWKYAQESPLSLAASLCFEQSYEGVEGDSAASTELYAILSSLSGVPLKQSMAVTGSVNQKGEIQPIGGVNHKIEGFYQVCQARGLTGDQGVLIPSRNMRNLMLKEEVVEAVQQGKFHIYAVNTVDEGIEVLTGIEAGQRQDDGTYPEGSVNYRVSQRLKTMAEGMRGFYSPRDGGKEKEGKDDNNKI
ncbi:MAG: AAA family ATPase [Chloroflexi bacterium]|nr:AAA family ATPase [Chloroflexota bacterium]